MPLSVSATSMCETETESSLPSIRSHNSDATAYQEHVDKSEAKFTLFNSLPRDIRLLIWGMAVPGPRILYLKQMPVLTDKEERWWERVRSDKAMWDLSGTIREEVQWDKETQADKLDNSDWAELGGSVGDIEMETGSTKDAKKLERLASRQDQDRLLLTATVNMATLLQQVEAENVMQNSDNQEEEMETGHRPKQLWGFKSCSSVPTLLLVCHESYEVASRFYSLAFSTLGCRPQTYFDFHRDTLYFDQNSFKASYGRRAILTAFEDDFIADDLSRVENLAIGRHVVLEEHDVGILYECLSYILSLFKNIRTITFVEEHYIHHRCVSTVLSHPGPQYMDLKYINVCSDELGALHVNGFRISKPYWGLGDHGPIYRKTLDITCDRWMRARAQQQCKVPELDQQVIASSKDEEWLLQDVSEFEEARNRGQWRSCVSKCHCMR